MVVKSSSTAGSACRRTLTACLAVLALTALTAEAGLRSALDRPDRPGPPLLTIGPTVGGSPDWQLFRYGASGSILFRPDAASMLFTPLYDWSTGLVLQWEYRDIDLDRDLLAADAILRRYFGDSGADGRAILFAGIGGGVARVDYPPPVPEAGDGQSDDEETADSSVVDASGSDKYASLVLELGYERAISPGIVVLWKVQWRSYVWGGRDYSNYAVHVQLGFPLPW